MYVSHTWHEPEILDNFRLFKVDYNFNCKQSLAEQLYNLMFTIQLLFEVNLICKPLSWG